MLKYLILISPHNVGEIQKVLKNTNSLLWMKQIMEWSCKAMMMTVKMKVVMDGILSDNSDA